MGLQSFHEWTHHALHHASAHHTHCGHHHGHVSIALPLGEAVAAHDACKLCDWDWLPAVSIDSKSLQGLSMQWCEQLKLGSEESGHCPQHCNESKSHRGPPWKA